MALGKIITGRRMFLLWLHNYRYAIPLSSSNVFLLQNIALRFCRNGSLQRKHIFVSVGHRAKERYAKY